jgi:hypothetical protein
MVKAESIIALSERLKIHAKNVVAWQQFNFTADLRLASTYLRCLAGYAVLNEARNESDPSQREQLKKEAVKLLMSCHDR